MFSTEDGGHVPTSSGAGASVGRRPGTRAGMGTFGRVLVVRLGPGEDLLPALDVLLADAGMTGGVILGGVASLRHLSVRNITRFPTEWPIRPDMREHTRIDGPLEVLSLQGNVAATATGDVRIHCHVEASVGNPPTTTCGGHLLADTIVATTAEVVVAEVDGLELRRVPDDVTQDFELDPGPREQVRDPDTLMVRQ